MKRSTGPLFALAAACLVSNSCAPADYVPGGIALVYGMSGYDGDLYLDYTDDDALAMAALLEEQGYTVLSSKIVDATKADIVGDIETAASALTPDDTFIFYYSGHGGQVYSGGADEPHGADAPDEYIFPIGSLSIPFSPELAISDDDLCELIAGLPVSRKVVILDSCNSGGFIGDQPEIDRNPPSLTDGSSGGGFFDALSAYVYYSKRDPSDVPFSEAVVISAAGERESSYESTLFGPGHGVFTYFFLQTPYSADADGDGYVTLSEAYAYAAGKVASEWNRSTNMDFLPRISGGSVDFVLFGR